MANRGNRRSGLRPCDPSSRPLRAARLKAKRVRVHLNLNNGCVVVSHGGKVQGYALGVTIKNAVPKISLAGFDRCASSGERNVHAYLQGDLVSGTATKPSGKGWRKIRYSCHEGPTFRHDNGGAFHGAQEVRIMRTAKGAEVWAKGRARKENPPSCGCTNPAGACSCGAVPWSPNPTGVSREDVDEEDLDFYYDEAGGRWDSVMWNGQRIRGEVASPNPPVRPCGSPVNDQNLGVHLIQSRPRACVVLLDMENVRSYGPEEMRSFGSCPLIAGWGEINGRLIAREGLTPKLAAELARPGAWQFEPELARLAGRLGVDLLELEARLCHEGRSWWESRRGELDKRSNPEGSMLVCAWCKRVLREGDPRQPVSHGICEECLEKERKKLRSGENPAADAGRYEYVTSCVGSTYEDIHEMLETEQRITRRTFAEKVGPERWKQIKTQLGYDRYFPISKDWHVTYGKGWYRHAPAVWLQHSAIEHIFTLDGKVGPSHAKGEKNPPPVPLTEKESAALRKRLGRKVAEARKKVGLSQRALAKTMGKSASWVREVESGAQYAPHYLVLTLAEGAQLPVGWFYGSPASTFTVHGGSVGAAALRASL